MLRASAWRRSQEHRRDGRDHAALRLCFHRRRAVCQLKSAPAHARRHPHDPQGLYQHDLPVQPGCSAEEMIAFTERNRDKITCINISRHLTKYVEESPDEVVACIATPKRVNCVLYMDYPADELRTTQSAGASTTSPCSSATTTPRRRPRTSIRRRATRFLADLKSASPTRASTAAACATATTSTTRACT